MRNATGVGRKGWALLAACMACGASALAEKADRAKPLFFVAQNGTADELKREAWATGAVVLTKGSIYALAEKVFMREDAQGYQHAVLTALPGKRVFFREKREGAANEFIEGEATTIEYDGQLDAVRLVGNGVFRQWLGSTLLRETTGDTLRYDNLNSRFDASATASGGNAAASAPRVRGMLVPRAALQQPAPLPADVDGPRLRGTDQLNGVK